ncbi:MAG: periplasmic heavy metal sensor [Aquabacterium sp.]|nr:periplasmic heavy metal sensor [Aquabacterium sp.]
MTSTTARLPRQHTTWFQLSAAAVLVAIVAMGTGRADAQPAMHDGQGRAQHAAHHRMAPGMGMGMPGMALPERLLDEVGATAEQKTKLREIYKAAADDLHAQHQFGRTLQAQMLALLAAPQVDAAAAEALRQQQLARHDTATKRTLQAMLDAQAVLTPEQRAKLAERVAARQKMLEQRHERRAPEAPKG